jgi:hypothetical protein
VSRFTSESKEVFAGLAGICITTFTMVAFSGKRSEESEKVRLKSPKKCISIQKIEVIVHALRSGKRF